VPEFLALPSGSAAREVVTRCESEIAYIDVNDPGILADVDDPQAYARLLAGSGA
jgi:CTP:molybdopterin cytidylyltransferase MocA